MGRRRITFGVPSESYSPSPGQILLLSKLVFPASFSVGRQSPSIFNSDLKKYWGTGDVFNPEVISKVVDEKENRVELWLQLPSLGAVILK